MFIEECPQVSILLRRKGLIQLHPHNPAINLVNYRNEANGNMTLAVQMLNNSQS